MLRIAGIDIERNLKGDFIGTSKLDKKHSK